MAVFPADYYFGAWLEVAGFRGNLFGQHPERPGNKLAERDQVDFVVPAGLHALGGPKRGGV